MNSARRVLILGGIALALWGMSYGLWYAVFAEHQALDGIGGNLSSAFASAAERQPAQVQAALNQYREAKYVYDRQVDAHSHWIGLAMILIVLGIALDHVSLSQVLKLTLASVALLGALLFPLGVLLQTIDRAGAPRAIAVLGSALLMLALLGFAWGFARARSPETLARGKQAL